MNLRHNLCTRLMRISRMAGLILALLPLTFLAAETSEIDNQLSPEEQSAGWALLFDGKSMEQWRSYGKADVAPAWQIQNNAIVMTSRGGGDLITRETWQNFELSLEWNISEGGNSGIFFLADESDKPIYVHAPEIQILDDKRHPDNKKANRRSGSLYDLVASPPAAQKPAGEWNQVILVHVNGHLTVWQNAVLSVDIALGSARWNDLVARSKFADWSGFGEQPLGHIGLQDHGDQVSFKNLKIRTLSVMP